MGRERRECRSLRIACITPPGPSIAAEPAHSSRLLLTKLKEYESREKLASRTLMTPSFFRGPITSPTVMSHITGMPSSSASTAPKSATGQMSRAVNSSWPQAQWRSERPLGITGGAAQRRHDGVEILSPGRRRGSASFWHSGASRCTARRGGSRPPR